ncbi:Hypothetical protein, putative [Bodo saltans]|uniref:FHA domain-containing protein n=1 Tax=Bodo saltans TaxID=75058 RepID=A0A0S4ITI7_BODSA|nr:Hypothetical protein, putative [Bodo saltans]|eukprot:CUF48890.1 Hypothetical protein, putative [Bodo saltans]
MFCRYLQFATKQQTLDLTAGDRLVVYAVEMYLRHAAKRYLRHNASRNDSDAHTGEEGRSAEPNTAATAPPVTTTTATNTKRHLVLVHPDVANVVELATHTSYDIGEDASCELQLRDPLVRALAMSLYSEKPRRELQQRSNIGNTSPRRDGSGYTPSSSSSGAKLSSAGRATPLNISLRQSYGLAPTHCNINFWHSIVQHPSEVSSSGSVATMNPAGTAAVSSAAIPSLFLENPYGNTVLVNGQSLSVHGERHLKDGDVIQYSKVCDAVSTTIGSSYAYDVDAVVRGRNE